MTLHTKEQWKKHCLGISCWASIASIVWSDNRSIIKAVLSGATFHGLRLSDGPWWSDRCKKPLIRNESTIKRSFFKITDLLARFPLVLIIIYSHSIWTRYTTSNFASPVKQWVSGYALPISVSQVALICIDFCVKCLVNNKSWRARARHHLKP